MIQLPMNALLIENRERLYQKPGQLFKLMLSEWN